MSRNWVAVAALPLIHARLLPCASMLRFKSKSSCASKPLSSSQDCRLGFRANSAEISVRLAPSRTTLASARAPSTSCKASTKIDLPAPVSPLSTPKPWLKSKSSCRTMTKSRRLMRCKLMSHPRSNAVFDAGYQSNSNRGGGETPHGVVICAPSPGRQSAGKTKTACRNWHWRRAQPPVR